MALGISGQGKRIDVTRTGGHRFQGQTTDRPDITAGGSDINDVQFPSPADAPALTLPHPASLPPAMPMPLPAPPPQTLPTTIFIESEW